MAFSSWALWSPWGVATNRVQYVRRGKERRETSSSAVAAVRLPLSYAPVALPLPFLSGEGEGGEVTTAEVCERFASLFRAFEDPLHMDVHCTQALNSIKEEADAGFARE